MIKKKKSIINHNDYDLRIEIDYKIFVVAAEAFGQAHVYV
ncbi:cobalamin biosynthesis protein [Bacillus wiedmannii]|uniref:Cobalamin biosynthesis protein n=1 Tax=Bacillus wiedmannii TaxID=1890302 RepID=A0A2A7BUP1_9BACI|nr:cobalamin biosynthesis protein [Bacillus wiedmannii]PFZ98327.1 cobalamin biosynthesis protein [Bacillus wiedmannii]TKH13842.1 cobalamin biosynthesis protein [Bacillus wiedmannii]TKI79780.1 cobalamin biosynthesis protein [Bacillus wiedmannii]HDR7670329.1 cobalamin biosynthesis protein [Bacillus wiedmannii]